MTDQYDKGKATNIKRTHRSTMTPSTHPSERRRSVRITGRSLFAYKVISPETFAEIKADYDNGISLYTQEHLLDLQVFIGAQKALSNIRERDVDLADFLQHLDTKINILLKKANGDKTPMDHLKLRDINISGQGIAFISKDPLDIGTIIEIQLAFLPSYTFVYGLATINSCEKLEKKEKTFYRIGAEFTLIMDDDKEALIQQNFKQQSLALRNRKKRQS